MIRLAPHHFGKQENNKMSSIKNPIFNHVMSRDGKRLRDQILDLCVKNGTGGKSPGEAKQFIDQIISTYDPIDWESAILFAYPDDIWKAIRRKTSSKFWEKQDPNKNKAPWERGSLSGSRFKKTNWLEVAKLDYSWWCDCIHFPRHDSAIKNMPDFNKVRDRFIDIYKRYVDWSPVDFNYKSLFSVYTFANKYDPEFVQECMDMVEDQRKRNIDYLLTIINNEYTYRQQEVEDSVKLTENSKQLLKSLVSTVQNNEIVDWEALEKRLEQEKDNRNEFDKVKLS